MLILSYAESCWGSRLPQILLYIKMLQTCQIDTTINEELQPLKDIRRWVGKGFSQEQSEIESKPEQKQSITEKMRYYQENEKEETQG